MQLREARNVFGPQMLRVLDTEAPIGRAIFVFETLIEIQDCLVGAVADRMHRDVETGAIGGLHFGKQLIGMYLGSVGFASTYGAAGSLLIILVWVYYSAQLFFFGAEFTKIYAGDARTRTVPLPDSHASEPVPAT